MYYILYFFIHLLFDKYIQLAFSGAHHSSFFGPTSAQGGALCLLHYWVHLWPSLCSSKVNHHATAILHHHLPYILQSTGSSSTTRHNQASPFLFSQNYARIFQSPCQGWRPGVHSWPHIAMRHFSMADYEGKVCSTFLCRESSQHHSHQP